MKTIRPTQLFVRASIAAFAVSLTSLLSSHAGEQVIRYSTIASSGSSVTLKEGETALVMGGAGVITYSKKGKPCAYIRLSKDSTRTLRETTRQALPLVGPAKITVRSCDGYLGMKIVSTTVSAPTSGKTKTAKK
ncbi:MAG: hypothetical protein ACPG32_08225 [Akkermansiaceae bacterium]